jgi:hypothetical protein
MPKKRPAKRQTQPPKGDDFKSVARRLGCDEDRGRFEAKLGKIAKTSMRATKGAKKK